MKKPFLLVCAVVALAACTQKPAGQGAAQAAAAPVATPATGGLAPSPMPTPAPVSGLASMPDHGALVAYAPVPAVERTAYTFRRVEVSEAHALHAIASGELVLPRPAGGAPIRLKYLRHIEHEGGNWTWIGRPEGAAPGTEAIITFGEKAVFGSIPDGDGPPLRLTMAGGHAMVVQTDWARERLLPGANPTRPDAIPVSGRRPASAGRRAAAAAPRELNTDMVEAAHLGAEALAAQQASASPANTLDLVLGYTSTFASRLGGQSQAVTRLTYLVDVGNQALANSQITGQVRLVRTVQVFYPDATDNGEALQDLTGCDATCSQDRPVPAALQPLRDARETYGADMLVLVRQFKEPENGGCGIAWLLGGGQSGITAADEYAATSVVSDSSGTIFDEDGFYCADEAMIHELGHNLGSAHDRETSSGDDGVLTMDEYGAFPYSFGYRTDANNGLFHTVMAYGNGTQHGYRVFSNPRITYCGGRACGVTDQADNARSIGQTLQTVAAFRAMVAKFGDVNGEHWAYDYIRRLGNSGVTSGCAAATGSSLALFCPDTIVSREQMAVFVERARRGAAYTPPAATGMFNDVPTSSPYAPWIEQLARDGIASGCGGGNYCPSSNVGRDQMAVFLVLARNGAGYTPPAMVGLFQDVPNGYWAGSFIEKLASDGITGGCGTNPPLYCPSDAVTRAQMAVFLVRAWNL